MKEFLCASEYFDPEQTLACGQTFRFERCGGGYFVVSADRACLVWREGNETHVRCEGRDEEYFHDYFDLGRDYAAVVSRAVRRGIPVLAAAAEAGKGIRMLRQDPEEMIFTAIQTQNNHIPRIRAIVARLSESLGEARDFSGIRYHSFPKAADLAQKDEAFFRAAGAGYRAAYLAETARAVARDGVERLFPLKTEDLRRELVKYKGIGEKVADCIALFGFARGDAFPVDTWIEKVYREDFGGSLTDRHKIAEDFRGEFGEDGGIVQQYLFHYKRNGPSAK